MSRRHGRVVAIIQARMESSRLPGKVLASIQGEPLLKRIIDRVRCSRRCDVVAVATTVREADDAIVETCNDAGVPVFRGNHEDVLDRYLRAARSFEADIIVRITADCPFVDPGLIDEAVTELQTSRVDYVTNTLVRTFPDGLDVEVFTARLLEQVAASRNPVSREHVTTEMRSRDGVRRSNFTSGIPDVGNLRWTVDYAEDLNFVRRVFDYFGGNVPLEWTEILASPHKTSMAKASRNESLKPTSSKSSDGDV